MAIKRPKMSVGTLPKRCREEVNVRILLNKCELMAKQEPVDENWRLKQYVVAVDEMIAELKTGPEWVNHTIFADILKYFSWQLPQQLFWIIPLILIT